jgi:hypothetical protein
MSSKRCNICAQTLPLEDFVKSTSAKSGRGARCKHCDNERHKALRDGVAPPLPPAPEPEPEAHEMSPIGDKAENEKTLCRLDGVSDDREALIAGLLDERNRLLEHANSRGLQINPRGIDQSLATLGYWSAP